MPEIAAHVELLAAQPDAAGLRALFTTWITLPQGTLDELVPAVADGAVRLAGEGRWQDVARSVLELAERYPGDAGVLAALLLNRVTLAPGVVEMKSLLIGEGGVRRCSRRSSAGCRAAPCRTSSTCARSTSARRSC